MNNPLFKIDDIVWFDWTNGEGDEVEENTIAKGRVTNVNLLHNESKVMYDVEFVDDLSDSYVSEDFIWVYSDIDINVTLHELVTL